jgi:hypothetical protein
MRLWHTREVRWNELAATLNELEQSRFHVHSILRDGDYVLVVFWGQSKK